MLTLCFECQVYIEKIWKEKRSQRNIFVNHAGQRWNGAQCPNCHNETKKTYYSYMKADERKMRSDQKKCIRLINQELLRLDREKLARVLDHVKNVESINYMDI